MLRAIGVGSFSASCSDPLRPNALGQLGGRGHGQGQRHHESADDDEPPDAHGVVLVQVEDHTHDEGADDSCRNISWFDAVEILST